MIVILKHYLPEEPCHRGSEDLELDYSERSPELAVTAHRHASLVEN